MARTVHRRPRCRDHRLGDAVASEARHRARRPRAETDNRIDAGKQTMGRKQTPPFLMNDSPKNETETIRSDIDTTRRRMDDTMDALGDRLQPRHLLDEFLGFLR